MARFPLSRLELGIIVHGLDKRAPPPAYAADITTAKQRVGFDYCGQYGVYSKELSSAGTPLP
jgi:preprotein translocase subunit SecA